MVIIFPIFIDLVFCFVVERMRRMKCLMKHPLQSLPDSQRLMTVMSHLYTGKKKKWWFFFLNKKEKRQHVREACFLQLTNACDIRPQVLNSSFDSTSTIQQDYHLFMNLFNTTLIFSTNPFLIEFEDSMHFVRLTNQAVLSVRSH